MGIFDRLFGKKQEPAQGTEAKPESERPVGEKPTEDIGQDILSNMLHSTYDPEKVRQEIRAKSLEAAAKVGAEEYVLAERETEAHADTLTITQLFPVDNKRFVVLDLETTGLEFAEHKIIEIGAVRVENGVITEEYSQMVNPETPIPPEASAVNHITNDMVADQPVIQEVLPSLLKFIGDDIVAAHNAKFDFSFLANACMLYFYRIPDRIFDTMQLARYWPEVGSKKLTRLLEAAGIEIEDAHRALSDARMTAKLVLAANEKRKKKK